jgi:hypothetical protein
MLIYHCFVTHHTTTQQENIDIKCAFQSYSIKKNILIQFLIQKKLIVVGLFLLLAGILLNQASFAPRILRCPDTILFLTQVPSCPFRG